ncbi:hypothetical protein EDB19DRAFT_1017422 [Suillus lakei]|nr:hypothetical protein EDB19DRAFT_1017422 [Suillus lakei]
MIQSVVSPGLRRIYKMNRCRFRGRKHSLPPGFRSPPVTQWLLQECVNNVGPYDGRPQSFAAVDLDAWAAGQPNAYYPSVAFSQRAKCSLADGSIYRQATEFTGHAHFCLTMYTTMVPDTVTPYAPDSDGTKYLSGDTAWSHLPPLRTGRRLTSLLSVKLVRTLKSWMVVQDGLPR